ncbi:hypothetical protein SBD_2509 [Streptomyces bottropensis ATCC 25435]|uniref:Uncharacterized protein n=1 Tax=Streptomyces bottropensis ATCC 25435 TaxID=1054862 RepID=M3FSN0_9ACTN|nr:hypothetical protein SBD_2509 [Streptomyces bottropensis ATCC 25435]
MKLHLILLRNVWKFCYEDGVGSRVRGRGRWMRVTSEVEAMSQG